MSLEEIAKQIRNFRENIILIYAFNATGKTRLSIEYKDHTKKENNNRHAGVYYNAFSEDLFIWDNDEENDNTNIKLKIIESSLNSRHSFIQEDKIQEKLNFYNPNYDFKFKYYDDPEKGIESVSFYISDDKNETPIKISRGEERIFVWCFFLALFEADDAWDETQKQHIFIDDPVSSLDDNNIFNTVNLLYELIKNNLDKKKIIITTHHIGLFSILCNRITKGDENQKFDKKYLIKVLERNEGKYILKECRKGRFLYHLLLLDILQEAINKDELYIYHFALLRQLLESISSFLGLGRFSYILEKIGIENFSQNSFIINNLSHQDAYTERTAGLMSPEDRKIFKDIIYKLKEKIPFCLQANITTTNVDK